METPEVYTKSRGLDVIFYVIINNLFFKALIKIV